ncbi:hypothetical protein ACFZ8E_15065 [Methylobacterium sp. HMF5984]|uniref:hypothetical protein n=1 Tax=Methylobacterium sp. HMF5984 TaxID=3367370 RepID=UPI0038519C8F
MGDDTEHLDEFGDVPAIELASDPLSIVPPDELQLIGEVMAWSAYIEADLFMLFLVAWPGDAERRRRQFYRDTRGMHGRAKLVRQSFEGRADGPIMAALGRLIEQVNILGSFRNDVAHNPLIRFGPKRALMRWTPGKGTGAGTLSLVDATAARQVMPAIRQLHDDLRNLAALLHSPSGGSFGITFGEMNERMEAQIARYVAFSNASDED